MQTSCRVFWAAAQGSRSSCTTISRHVHSSARNPLIKPSSQPPSLTIPCAFGAVRDVHVQKRRRYSSSQGAPAPAPLSVNKQAGQYMQDTQRSHAPNPDNEDVQPFQPFQPQKQPSKMQKADRHSISSTDNVLDGDGRLKTPFQSHKPLRGAPGKGKNKRLELKDLAIPKKKEPWQIQKQALKEKFGDAGWNPRKKLSPDTMEGIRTLHEQDPDRWSTAVLADHFKVSPEAVRRILKSKWRPSEKEMEKRRERWAKRHDRIWDKLAELGLRPQRTQEKALEGPDEFEESLRAKEILDNARNA